MRVLTHDVPVSSVSKAGATALGAGGEQAGGLEAVAFLCLIAFNRRSANS